VVVISNIDPKKLFVIRSEISKVIGGKAFTLRPENGNGEWRFGAFLGTKLIKITNKSPEQILQILNELKNKFQNN
jgi:hypothetical protein